MRIVAVLIIALLSQPAFAGWSAESIDLVNNYNCSDGSTEDIHGQFVTRDLNQLSEHCEISAAAMDGDRPYYLGIKDGLAVEFLFKPSFAEQDYLSYYVSMQRDSFNNSTNSMQIKLIMQSGPAELIVYLPGVFQGLNDKYTMKAIELFYNQGYHVLVIPNGLSEDYHKSKPLNCGGNYVSEADNVIDIIEQLKENYPTRIEEVNLAGISYGGFLASVVAAKAPTGLIEGSITIVGPQLNIAKSIRHLDSLSEKKLIKEPLAKIVGTLFQRSTANHTRRLIELYQLNANHEAFLSGASPLEKEKAFNHVSQLQKLDATQTDRYYKSASFENIVTNLCPDITQLYDPNSSEAYLSTWLELAYEKNTNIRLLFAANDYSIPEENIDWSEYLPSYLLTPEHLLIRASGGHNGFIMTNWFSRFVESSFPKN